jgi:hypothetical protein
VSAPAAERLLNEAADRLRGLMRGGGWASVLEDALAAERRVLVERVRVRLDLASFAYYSGDDVLAILDEEAQR